MLAYKTRKFYLSPIFRFGGSYKLILFFFGKLVLNKAVEGRASIKSEKVRDKRLGKDIPKYICQ